MEHRIDPETGIWPIEEWGSECGRGFVSDGRFRRSGKERIIKRADRAKTRKWYRLGRQTERKEADEQQVSEHRLL